MPGRAWTVAEIEAIRTVAPGGVAEVARRLGRTVRAIEQMRWARGFARPVPRWTRAERAQLDAAVAGGATVAAATAAVGRTMGAAYSRRSRVRGRGETPPAPPVAGLGRRGYQGQFHRARARG